MNSKIAQNSPQKSSRPLWPWQAVMFRSDAASWETLTGMRNSSCLKEHLYSLTLKKLQKLFGPRECMWPCFSLSKWKWCKKETCAPSVKSFVQLYYGLWIFCPSPFPCYILVPSEHWAVASSFTLLLAPPSVGQSQVPSCQAAAGWKSRTALLNKQVRETQFPAVDGAVLQNSICKSVLWNLEDIPRRM